MNDTPVSVHSSRAAIAMSGGVDSAVAALLLKQELPSVCGVTMTLYRENADEENADVLDARAVADRIGIEHTVCDLGAAFRRDVIDPFCREYACGRTPNPCIVCNKHIKFGALWKFVHSLGCDVLATGHYARIELDANGAARIRRAVDRTKDQTYMLWSLTQDILQHVRFPLGELSKSEVRDIALAHGFESAHRRDSQDICFIPDGDYVGFLSQYAGITPSPGSYIDTAGAVIGKHKGMLCYTIGQRKGLGMSFGKHMFVCAKDAANNTVTLCEGDELFSRRLTARNANFISGKLPTSPLHVQAKIRYAHEAAEATVHPLGDGRILVEFDEAQRAIAPGQSVVLYDGDELLGGGVIE